MSPVVSIKNKASIEIDTCDELIHFDSNEVEAHYLDIELIKSQDCIWAIHGKNLKYCVLVRNNSGQDIYDLLFRDMLDNGVQYVPESFTVDGAQQTPIISGHELSYNPQK